MLDEKKKWFLLNSGGGAQAIIPNIQGYSKDLTTADVFATDSGASIYTFQRSTSSDMSGATEVQSGASRTLNDTGLTAGVTYYYRVKGDGGSWSQTIQITTIPYSPVFWLEGSGLKYGTDNAYGTTTFNNVDVLKSIINTTVYFTKVSQAQAHRAAKDKYPGAVIGNGNTAGFLTSDVGASTLGLNFTIILPLLPNGSFSSNYLASSNGSADTGLRTGMTSMLLLFGGTSHVYTYPSALVDTKWANLIVQGRQSGNDCIVKVSVDGGLTWTAEQTHTAPTNGPILSRLFSNSSGGAAINLDYIRFVALNNVLTYDQIQLYLDYNEGATYTPRANTALIPTDITFPNTLPVNGIIVNSVFDNVLTSSFVRHTTWTYGDYTYIRINKKEEAPYYAQDCVIIVNWAIGKYSDLIELPIYNQQAADYHASGSLAPMRDNTLQHWELEASYDYLNNRRIMIQQFGDNMNLASQTALPRLKGQAQDTDFFLSYFQYYQFADLGNTRVVFGHTSQGFARYISYYRTIDNGNNGQFINIADTGAGSNNWFYYKLVVREDGVIEMLLNHLLIGSSRYNYVFALRSHINDLNNWSNFGGTFTKDISNNNPLTMSELTTNYVLKSTPTSGNAFTFHGAYDEATDVTAVLVTNGSETGIQLAISEGGAAFGALIDVDWGALSMNFADVYTSEIYDNHFFVIIDGVDSYTVGAATDNAGKNQIAIVSTTDGGTTWSTPTIFSTDDTKRFQRFYPAHNSQSQARKVIVGAVEVSSTEGSLFVKQL